MLNNHYTWGLARLPAQRLVHQLTECREHEQNWDHEQDRATNGSN